MNKRVSSIAAIGLLSFISVPSMASQAKTEHSQAPKSAQVQTVSAQSAKSDALTDAQIQVKASGDSAKLMQKADKPATATPAKAKQQAACQQCHSNKEAGK